MQLCGFYFNVVDSFERKQLKVNCNYKKYLFVEMGQGVMWHELLDRSNQ